jgi:protein phosphatase
MLELVPGDRLFLCSDGACGVLDDGRLADVLSMGTPDYAAVELVRASLEAGSSDNVTCIVADVVTEEAAAADPAYNELEPMLVGAAAELRRRSGRTAVSSGVGSLFRGHRSGDTGELEPIDAELLDEVPFAIKADPIDPEAARYAPRPPARYQWAKRLLVLAVVVGVVWSAGAVAWSWSQDQFYIGEHEGKVTIFRGINADLPGISLSDPYQSSDVELSLLPELDAERVEETIEVDDLEAAEAAVQELAELQAVP